MNAFPEPVDSSGGPIGADVAARSAAAKASAESRRCPMCDRGNALGREVDPARNAADRYNPHIRARTCRWCGFYMEYERVT